MWSIRYCALRTAHCIFCENCVILISIVYAMYTLQYVCYITILIWRRAGHLMGCFPSLGSDCYEHAIRHTMLAGELCYFVLVSSVCL